MIEENHQIHSDFLFGMYWFEIHSLEYFEFLEPPQNQNLTNSNYWQCCLLVFALLYYEQKRQKVWKRSQNQNHQKHCSLMFTLRVIYLRQKFKNLQKDRYSFSHNLSLNLICWFYLYQVGLHQKFCYQFLTRIY